MMTIETSIAVFGGICGIFGLAVSLVCVACVVGFLRSTHTVQYLPVETPKMEDDTLLPPQIDIEEEILKKVGRKPKPPMNLAEEAVEDITQTDNF